MKQFSSFDEYKHKKTMITIGSAIYEIWHQKTFPESRVKEIAERIQEQEIGSGKNPVGLYRHDFRDLYA